MEAGRWIREMVNQILVNEKSKIELFIYKITLSMVWYGQNAGIEFLSSNFFHNNR